MRYMIYALLLSAGVTILLGPVLIPLLKRLKFGQCERELGPKSHLTKQGTPPWGADVPVWHPGGYAGIFPIGYGIGVARPPVHGGVCPGGLSG